LFCYSAVHIYNRYKNVLLESNINKMVIEIWKLLSHIAETEMEDLSSVNREYRKHLRKQLKETVESIKYLLSTGEKYTCSYLFFFRKILLDHNLMSEVRKSIFLYHVYQLNIYI